MNFLTTETNKWFISELSDNHLTQCSNCLKKLKPQDVKFILYNVTLSKIKKYFGKRYISRFIWLLVVVITKKETYFMNICK